MKIAVIAANGRTGKEFVSAALLAGHEVQGGVRTVSNLAFRPNLTVLKCDALNEQDVRKLLKGQDVVVSLIGHVKGADPMVQTKAIENVIKIMKETKIKRMISLTGTGVRLPGDKITLADRFLNLGVSLAQPARVKDGRAHYALLSRSSLDWTVLRVLKLQDSQSKPYQLSLHGPTKIYVGRQETAQALLELIEKKSFIRQAPIISKP